MRNDIRDYLQRLSAVLETTDLSGVESLGQELLDCWRTGRQLFLCGNGGSAANAIHLANDFLYGISKRPGSGLRVTALPANSSVLTCLANDMGYDQVFALQLAVLARPGDVLLAFSGSGNSPNILRALEKAREIGMRSYAVLGYSGGQAKALADVPLHFAIDDMQISEDIQLILGHLLMQWLYRHRDQVA
ncbi:MAG: SIS domain-containing protein [Azospirillaceae bacterium]|nr:SIS domain-containing protein [Azospirillaceae bacterium]